MKKVPAQKLLRGGSVLALTFFIGCGQPADSVGDQSEDFPVAPDGSSLTMDLAILPTAVDYGAEAGESLVALNSSYFNTARLVVAIVNINVARAVIWPVVLLQENANIDPTLVSANSWLWSYETAVANRNLAANLRGSLESDAIRSWNLEVTTETLDQAGCCEEYLLLTGQASTVTEGEVEITTGSWQLYDYRAPSGSTAWYSVDYELIGDVQRSLVFTLDSEEAATESFGVGSTVAYVATADQVTLTINNSVATGESIITWDRATLAGSFTGVNGQEVCWDTQDNGSVNIDCVTVD